MTAEFMNYEIDLLVFSTSIRAVQRIACSTMRCIPGDNFSWSFNSSRNIAQHIELSSC